MYQSVNLLAALKGLVADMIESHSTAKEESSVKISALAKVWRPCWSSSRHART